MTTTPDQRARFTNAIAAAMCVLRPEWDVPGCVAALRSVPAVVPLSELMIAAAKYAADPDNVTPKWLSALDNRAWEAATYPPCRSHPETRGRRLNGQCASCWADSNADEASSIRDRGGHPIPVEARRLFDAALRREKVMK